MLGKFINILKVLTRKLNLSLFQNGSGLLHSCHMSILNFRVPNELHVHDCSHFINTTAVNQVSRQLDELIQNKLLDVPLFREKVDNHLYFKLREGPSKDFIDKIVKMSELKKHYNSFGLDISPIHFSFSKNTPTSDEITYSTKWHFDMEPLTTTMMFINLSNVAEEHGPYHYMDSISGPSNKILDNTLKTDASRITTNYSKLVGPIGTAVMTYNPKILHRASEIQAGSRLMAILWFRVSKIK